MSIEIVSWTKAKLLILFKFIDLKENISTFLNLSRPSA
jgi:hypothetical protein